MADEGFMNRAQRPLAGVILCCTSVLPEKRSELAAIATQMGAEHNLDLTSDVTHLLVGDPNTPKYKYVAKEREDVKVLRPEWVEAVRESWMKGGDTDVEALETEHKLPTFAGLSICLTGFDDIGYRARLQEAILSNGGNYTGDLMKSVTHLIARVPEGKKYQYAIQWNIKIVSPKWFNDSLARGMALDEALYHPTLPEINQGVGAWKRMSPRTSLGKRVRDNAAAPNPTRKLRRTASAKLGSQNGGIWTDIVGFGVTTLAPQDAPWDESDRIMRPPVRSTSAVEEPKSFTSETTVQGGSMLAVTDRQLSSDIPQKPKGFLQGRHFFIFGFTSRQMSILEDHLSSHDAQVVSVMENLPSRGQSYVIVPHNFSRESFPPTQQLGRSPEITTELWLERCLVNKQFESPSAHPTSRPFPSFPISGFESLRICSTGFPGIERLHVLKVVTVMGATYDEELTSKASAMICNTGQARIEKLRHAYEWSVPAVNPNWLWDSVRESQILPFKDYLVDVPESLVEEIRAARAELEKTNHDRRRLEKNQTTRLKDAERSKFIPRKHPSVSHLDGQDVLMPDRSHTLFATSKSTTASTSKSTSASTSSEALVPTLPLQEISTNSPPKPRSPTGSPSPQKVISQVEAPVASFHPSNPVPSLSAIHPPGPGPRQPVSSNANNPNTTKKRTSSINPIAPSLSRALSSFLEKTKRNANSKPNPSSIAATASSSPTRRRRPLLGRANSHSSSSGRQDPQAPTVAHGNVKALSRTNSIGSLNSDGLGSVIGTQTQTQTQTHDIAAQIAQWQDHAHLPAHLRPDMPDPSTKGEVDVVLTQLGYADPLPKQMRDAAHVGGEGESKMKVRDVEGFSSGLARSARKVRGKKGV